MPGSGFGLHSTEDDKPSDGQEGTCGEGVSELIIAARLEDWAAWWDARARQATRAS